MDNHRPPPPFAQRAARADSLRRLSYLRGARGAPLSLAEKVAAAASASSTGSALLARAEGFRADARAAAAVTTGRAMRREWVDEWTRLCAAAVRADSAARVSVARLGDACVRDEAGDGSADEDSGDEANAAFADFDRARTARDLVAAAARGDAFRRSWRDAASAAISALKQSPSSHAALSNARIACGFDIIDDECCDGDTGAGSPTRASSSRRSAPLGMLKLLALLSVAEADDDATLADIEIARTDAAAVAAVRERARRLADGASDDDEGGEAATAGGDPDSDADSSGDADADAGEGGAVEEEGDAGCEGFWAAVVRGHAERAGCRDSDLISSLARDLTDAYGRNLADARAARLAWTRDCDAWGVRPNDPFGGWSSGAHFCFMQISRAGAPTAPAPTAVPVPSSASHLAPSRVIAMQVSKLLAERTSVLAPQSLLPPLSSLSPSRCTASVATASAAATSLPVADVINAPTVAQVEAHAEWAAARIAMLRRARARRETWRAERARLLSASRAACASSAARAAALTRATQDAAAADARTRKIKAAHAAASARCALDESLRNFQNAMAAAAAEDAAAADAECRARWASSAKAALAAYAAARAAADARVQEARAAADAAAVARIRADTAVGAARVRARAEADASARANAAATARAAAAEADAVRERSLEAVLATLPNRARLEEIANTHDAGRVTSHTVSSGAAAALSSAFAAYVRLRDEAGDAGATVDDVIDWTRGGRGLKAGSGELIAVVGGREGGDDDNDGGPGRARERAAAVERARVLHDIAAARIRDGGLFGRTGFSDAAVTKHKGFRLVSALRAGGLGGTAGVRPALAAVNVEGRGTTHARAQIRETVL